MAFRWLRQLGRLPVLDSLSDTSGIMERIEHTKSKHKLPVAKDAIMLFRIELYGSGRYLVDG